VIPFTAEEAWEHLPGSNAASIHLQDFPTVETIGIDENAWAAFFATREQLNTAMDIAKKDKVVGSSIAAAVTVPDLDAAFSETVGESYEQLFIIAKVEAGDELTIAAADGIKCPRCWNVSEPAQPEHDTHNELCPRCYNVVTA